MRMSVAVSLPRKYLSILVTTREELQVLARRARTALEEVESEDEPYQLARIILRDIEAEAYRLALELSTLEVTGSCDGCPSAPPTTEANVMLLVIAGELERQANIARSHVIGRSYPTTNGNGNGGELSGIRLQWSENGHLPSNNGHAPNGSDG
jgi:hypothetical protein